MKLFDADFVDASRRCFCLKWFHTRCSCLLEEQELLTCIVTVDISSFTFLYHLIRVSLLPYTYLVRAWHAGPAITLTALLFHHYSFPENIIEDIKMCLCYLKGNDTEQGLLSNLVIYLFFQLLQLLFMFLQPPELWLGFRRKR